MPVNRYDDCKVSLRRPHGNGDLDIVGASLTRRKANVTEALMPYIYLFIQFGALPQLWGSPSNDQLNSICFTVREKTEGDEGSK